LELNTIGPGRPPDDAGAATGEAHAARINSSKAMPVRYFLLSHDSSFPFRVLPVTAYVPPVMAQY